MNDRVLFFLGTFASITSLLAMYINISFGNYPMAGLMVILLAINLDTVRKNWPRE